MGSAQSRRCLPPRAFCPTEYVVPARGSKSPRRRIGPVVLAVEPLPPWWNAISEEKPGRSLRCTVIIPARVESAPRQACQVRVASVGGLCQSFRRDDGGFRES